MKKAKNNKMVWVDDGYGRGFYPESSLKKNGRKKSLEDACNNIRNEAQKLVNGKSN